MPVLNFVRRQVLLHGKSCFDDGWELERRVRSLSLSLFVVVRPTTRAADPEVTSALQLDRCYPVVCKVGRGDNLLTSFSHSTYESGLFCCFDWQEGEISHDTQSITEVITSAVNLGVDDFLFFAVADLAITQWSRYETVLTRLVVSPHSSSDIGFWQITQLAKLQYTPTTTWSRHDWKDLMG